MSDRDSGGAPNPKLLLAFVLPLVAIIDAGISQKLLALAWPGIQMQLPIELALCFCAGRWARVNVAGRVGAVLIATLPAVLLAIELWFLVVRPLSTSGITLGAMDIILMNRGLVLYSAVPLVTVIVGWQIKWRLRDQSLRAA